MPNAQFEPFSKCILFFLFFLIFRVENLLILNFFGDTIALLSKAKNKKRGKKMNNNNIDEMIKKLKEYEQLEKEGRLIKLPCKPGETIYVVNKLKDAGKMHYHKIARVCRQTLSSHYYDTIGERFGKDIFLTEKEAVACIKRMEEQRRMNDYKEKVDAVVINSRVESEKYGKGTVVGIYNNEQNERCITVQFLEKEGLKTHSFKFETAFETGTLRVVEEK